MRFEINRPDIKSAVFTLLDTITCTLNADKKFELLEWIIQVVQEYQDNIK